jgi:peptidoglycan/LPS O-acetylase OafA/YrhL
MSYSLYLVHAPLLWMMAFLLKTQAHFSATRTMLALIALSPAVLGIAWLLFYTVERRTLTHPPPSSTLPS